MLRGVVKSVRSCVQKIFLGSRVVPEDANDDSMTIDLHQEDLVAAALNGAVMLTNADANLKRPNGQTLLVGASGGASLSPVVSDSTDGENDLS